MILTNNLASHFPFILHVLIAFLTLSTLEIRVTFDAVLDVSTIEADIISGRDHVGIIFAYLLAIVTPVFRHRKISRCTGTARVN